MKGTIIAMLLCLVACENSKKSAPNNLIQKNQMVDLITELHLAEAKVQNMGYRSSDSSFLVYEKLQLEVLQKHKVSKADYDSSYAFYSRNLKEFDEIYAKVVDSLSLKESKLSDL